MTTYVPKKGDRVRVTIEGSVTEVSNRGDWFDVGANCIDLDPKRHDGATYTIEKLADPEPEWVNGDVVKAGIFVEAYRLGGEWRNLDGDTHYFSRGGSHHLTEAWRDGKVEILYKADQQGEVA